MSAPVDWDPLVARVPAQLPEAAQEVALVELHVRVAVPPEPTDDGLIVSMTVGAGGGSAGPVTVTAADVVAVPPGPVQANA